MDTLDLKSLYYLLAKSFAAKLVGFLVGEVVGSGLLKMYYCFKDI